MNTDATSALLIECVEVPPGSRALVLGALNGAVALAVALAAAPGGKLYLADYDTAALDQAEQALRHGGAADVALISPDRLDEFEPGSLDVALLQIAPFASSALVLRLIHAAGRALRPGALLYAAGSRDKGIVSVGKRMAELFGDAGTLRYSKGSRVISAVRPADWPHDPPVTRAALLPVTLRGHTFELALRDGVFARGSQDEGTTLLCNALDLAAADTVLDLGCGGGLLGMLAARLTPAGYATLVDSNSAAVALAQQNIAHNGIGNATALVSDSVAAVLGQRFSVVATNPPFHHGRVQSGDTALRLIADAPQVTAPGGSFYLVGNRFLPYERPIAAAFGNVREIAGNSRYRVLLAVSGSG